MNINDYIHLYINSEARHRLKYVDGEGFTPWVKLTEGRYRGLEDLSIEKVEYALRRLEDMTEDEKKEISFESYNMLRNEQRDRVLSGKEKACFWAAKQTHYLLKQGFDLFNLIDQNLAEDIKNIQS